MHQLPPIAARQGELSLPLSAGAVWLITNCLAGVSCSESQVCSALLRDPPLVLFLIAHRIGDLDLQRVTFRSLATDISATHLSQLLCWPDSAVPSDLSAPHDSAADWALLAQARARQAAEGQAVLDSERAVVGFLFDVENWCSPAEDSLGPSQSIPTWQLWLHGAMADDSLRPADNTASGPIEQLLPAGEIAKITAHWQVHDSALWLPQMAAQVRRLQRLEQQFAEELRVQKLSAMKELAYGASHEINNPLANISSRAQTLLRDEPDADRQKTLAAINRQAFRAHEMIADLMLFANPPELEFEKCSVEKLFRCVIEEMADEAKAQSTRLTTAPLDGPLELQSDATQLTVALKALVRNALESLGSGGHVELSARHDAPHQTTCLTVRDDGPGIGAEMRQHLFDPFFSGREAGRGLGFGLSKVWRIAEEHGGSVVFDSNAAQSQTTFSLHLPSRKQEE